MCRGEGRVLGGGLYNKHGCRRSVWCVMKGGESREEKERNRERRREAARRGDRTMNASIKKWRKKTWREKETERNGEQ